MSDISTSVVTQAQPQTVPLPPASLSIHGPFLEKAIPDWLVNATPQRRAALKSTEASLPDWYLRASPAQRTALQATCIDSFNAQTSLDKAMEGLQDIDTYARPLLVSALKDQLKVELDVDDTYLVLKKPLDIGIFSIEVSHFEVLKLPLLQAALHNFEASECETGAFHASSGFQEKTASLDTFQAITPALTIPQFTTLCRSLDIGAKYQAYLKNYLQPDPVAAELLRTTFKTAQKTALRAAAEIALLKQDINRQDYEMLVSVTNGNSQPWEDGKRVGLCDLALMGRQMTGCILFSIGSEYGRTDELILYIPNDPESPLKRCTHTQMAASLKQRFTAREASAPGDVSPTAYQQFFSQFVAYADRPYYFSQFTQNAPSVTAGEKLAAYLPMLNKFSAVLPLAVLYTPKDLPPVARLEQSPNPDPYLAPDASLRRGPGVWTHDLWDYLFEQHRDKLIADASAHAVPTAEVDAKVRSEKLAKLLDIGLLVLNAASMFVPVLGELMMGAMVARLLSEVGETVHEWQVGDRQAVKAHLIDLAENVITMALMAAGGKVLGKLTAVKPEPVIERMEQVTLPNGETRLWKPDLSGYESAVKLEASSGPNALGEYEVDGKTYIRHEGRAYQKTYDETLQRWRITHPTDQQAYQPVLTHNGVGAWRHTLERPQAWDRLTLLRRMGHVTEGVSDESLLKAADISDVSEHALRKMHVDNLPPPPELVESLRLFKPGGGMEPVIIDNGLQPKHDFILRLQRLTPGLSESAAKAVLAEADSEELARLLSTPRVPLRMLEQARWYARQGRLSSAYASLLTQNMASADSKLLALHALRQLPGWPDNLRLEIRDTRLDGALIDALGSDTAQTRAYLVKKGPAYQAFDGQGESLNNNLVAVDDFFSSLVQALPDEARRALGVPDVRQAAELRTAINDYAIAHPDEMKQVLEKHAAKKMLNKPPQRLSDNRVGYLASGRGAGIDASLVTRVQDVYPALTDQQAMGYLLDLRRAGQTTGQIYGRIQELSREWQTLESTLDAWVSAPTPEAGSSRSDAIADRHTVARNIKEAWRNAPLANEVPSYRKLVIKTKDTLPPLTASFAHVRDLTLDVPNTADSLLALCPSVEKLDLRLSLDNAQGLSESLGSLPQLTSLTLFTLTPAQVIPNLAALANLEELDLNSFGWSGDTPALDVRGFTRLRRLRVYGREVNQWPVGVLELPQLERLDLRGTRIETLPAELFPGHDRLLAGLSLEWSKIPRDAFKPLYEYVCSQPSHLINLNDVVTEYANGELFRLAAAEPVNFLSRRSNLVEVWPGVQDRFNAIEAFCVQSDKLDGRLAQWLASAPPQAADRGVMNTVAATLKTNWRRHLVHKHIFWGGRDAPPVLDVGHPAYRHLPFELDMSGVHLNSLPELPDGLFNHVKILKLANMRVPGLSFQKFVSGFNQVRTLDLRNIGARSMPFKAGFLPELEHLNLSHNPLTELNVSTLGRLRALSLRATQMQALPYGAEFLRELSWLDMRDTSVSNLVLSPAQEGLLVNTHLSETLLGESAQAALMQARQRLEQTRGLPDGTLTRLALEPMPETFDPMAGRSLNIDELLPLLPVEPVQGVQPLHARVRRLCPTTEESEALQWVNNRHEEGLTDVQLHERIDGWNQTFESLTRRLNGWLFIRESRVGDCLIALRSRRAAALKIVECWRAGLLTSGGEASAELDLRGRQLGDLPELPSPFTHVGTLNLAGVRLSEQGSNEFLRAFPNVHTLDLGANRLLSELPAAIADMRYLQRLDLSYNAYTTSDSVYRSLSGLEHLQELNLASNNLHSFSLEGLAQLEQLNLRNNRLSQWPGGVWQAEALTHLNLANNDLSLIPQEALDGTRDPLLVNTDLTDNIEMSRSSLERLYLHATQRRLDPVAGFRLSELEDLIDGESDTSDSDSNASDGESESDPSDEELPEAPAGNEDLALWLQDLDSGVQPDSRALWDGLLAEPGHEAFFHLLARLGDTAEFRVSRSDLTRRVWEVVKATSDNTELRQTVFRMSDTHGTCVDGRILTFSGLEVKVFEYNALRDIDPSDLEQKGAALLKLSRQLFRLGEVEKLADESINAPGRRSDPAEVRLQYRVSLKDKLDLPAQPGAMTYAKSLIGHALTRAIDAVNAAEASDAFYEDLIARDYWVDYLKQKYPEVFTALDQSAVGKREKLENDHSDFGEGYSEAVTMLEVELTTERNQKLLELSHQEVAQLSPAVRDPEQPGPSSAFKGNP